MRKFEKIIFTRKQLIIKKMYKMKKPKLDTVVSIADFLGRQ